MTPSLPLSPKRIILREFLPSISPSPPTEIPTRVKAARAETCQESRSILDFKSSVDLTLFERLRADWEFIQADLIAEVDKDFVVFEERVFKTELFARYLSRYQIAWLRISLQSGIPSQSKRLCRSLSNTLENIFNEIRSGMRSLTIADIKEVLRIEIRKSILHYHHVHPGTNEFSEEFSSGES